MTPQSSSRIGSAVDIVVVLRAPLEQYPPSLNQVALLSEAGLRVTVVDTRHQDYKLFEFSSQRNIERVHAVEHTQNFKQATPSRLERVRRAIAFQCCVRRTIAQRKPAVVIAYDPNGMIAVGKLWKQRDAPKLVWHFHELFLPRSAGGGFFTKRSIEFASKYCDRADLVIFPDGNRCRVYQEEAQRTFSHMIVKNCPRRLETLPEDKLRPRLHELGVAEHSKIVFFQGWIGPSRCFEAIVESMKLWPNDAVFVLIGPVSDRYRQELLDLAVQSEVGTKLLFLGTVPYQEILSWTVGSDLGLAIVSDSVEKDLSWRYSAGAVNKRFEYMAAGVSQVANQGPGMRELIEDENVGCLVAPDSPTEIGACISELLTDDKRLVQTGRRARKLHLAVLCYERQFQPLLERINAWVQERG